MQIAEHVFIDTGGASGLGAATARMIVDNGGKVVLADVQAEAGEGLAAELGEGRARFVRCDVTQEADGQAAVAAALQMGSLRGLVNCAGVATPGKLVGRDGPLSAEVLSRVLAINTVGTVSMMAQAAAAMKAQEPLGEDRGVIVNTASVAAYDGQIGQIAYSASKGAVVSLTLPAARELASSQIRVVTIAPGLMETPMMAGLPEAAREDEEAEHEERHRVRDQVGPAGVQQGRPQDPGQPVDLAGHDAALVEGAAEHELVGGLDHPQQGEEHDHPGGRPHGVRRKDPRLGRIAGVEDQCL